MRCARACTGSTGCHCHASEIALACQRTLAHRACGSATCINVQMHFNIPCRLFKCRNAPCCATQMTWRWRSMVHGATQPLLDAATARPRPCPHHGMMPIQTTLNLLQLLIHAASCNDQVPASSITVLNTMPVSRRFAGKPSTKPAHERRSSA